MIIIISPNLVVAGSEVMKLQGTGSNTHNTLHLFLCEKGEGKKNNKQINCF